MLFKPWHEVQNPRHLLAAEEENFAQYIPRVETLLETSIDGADDTIDYFIISHNTTSALVGLLPKGKVAGKIIVEFSATKDELNREDEYDEDEQLYAAMTSKSVEMIHKPVEVPIIDHGNKLFSTSMIHFSHPLCNGLVARSLISKVSKLVKKSWIVLPSCELKGRETLNKLEVGDIKAVAPELASVPTLKPPHFVAGISASIASQVSLQPGQKLVALVLRSEGQPGYEKINVDSFIDSSFVLGEILNEYIDMQEYMKLVSSRVRKLNSYANSGMYI